MESTRAPEGSNEAVFGRPGEDRRRRWLRLGGLVSVPTAVVAGAAATTAILGSNGFEWAWVGIPTAGAVILANRPGNGVGRSLFTVGGVVALMFATGILWTLGIGGVWPLWVNAWGWPAAFLILPTFLTVFPDERPTPRWRRLLAGYLVFAAALVCYYGLRPGPLLFDAAPDVHAVNPTGVGFLAPLRGSPIETAAAIAALGFAVVAAGGLALRWRRSRGLRRLQFRWLGVALAIMATLAGLGTIFNGATWADAFGVGAFVVGLNGVAAAIMVAISRYGLYEIDRIVSRTITHGIVILALAGVYASLVTALTRLLPAQSELAVASATLVIAALFAPARRRVQAVVDRRFNRTRYAADRELESLALRLREVTDAGLVESDLVDVVARTLAPSSVTLWMRPGAEPP